MEELKSRISGIIDDYEEDQKKKSRPEPWQENQYWFLFIGFTILIALIFIPFYILYVYSVDELSIWFVGVIKDKGNSEPNIRKWIICFLAGNLGATVFGAYFFAKDCNRYYKERRLPANITDSIGYIIFIISGGPSALIITGLIKAGVIGVKTNSQGYTLSMTTMFVFGFIAGYFSSKLKSLSESVFLEAFVKKS